MGKLDPNTVVGVLRGKLGDLVFVPATDGTVIVRHRPSRETAFSPREKDNQRRFAEAAAYVRRSRQEPELYALYQAAARLQRKRACDLAHADYRHAPVVQDIQLAAYRGNIGETIRIVAVDDFAVASVSMALLRLDGVLLEQGQASRGAAAGEWLYLTQTQVPAGQTIVVQATAKDHPGHEANRSEHWALPAAI